MSKFTKLLTRPGAFWRDFYQKRSNADVLPLMLEQEPAPKKEKKTAAAKGEEKGGDAPAANSLEARFLKKFKLYGPHAFSSGKPVAVLFGFNDWKRTYAAHYLEDHVVACPSIKTHFPDVVPLLDALPDKVIVAWACHAAPEMEEYCDARGLHLWRMEDGFIRSAEIGAKHTPPMSLAMDSRGIYFDPRSPSDLEKMLAEYDFDGDAALLERAANCMKLMRRWGVSKYNHAPSVPDIAEFYGRKTRKRILVIGQVEEDASIVAGAGEIRTNEALITAALSEHPGAEVIYKPHPDVMAGCRRMLSDPSVLGDAVKIVTAPLSTPDALKTIDHVYTITSLVGMEALIRGIPVTCFGAPFYSGWGLTDDRLITPYESRRGRVLTLEALFAGAYLLYPGYRDPQTGAELEAEEVIFRLAGPRNGITRKGRTALRDCGFFDDEIFALLGEEGSVPAPAAGAVAERLAAAATKIPAAGELPFLAAWHFLLSGDWRKALLQFPNLRKQAQLENVRRVLTELIARQPLPQRELLGAALEMALFDFPAGYARYARAFRDVSAYDLAERFGRKAYQRKQDDMNMLALLSDVALHRGDATSATFFASEILNMGVKITGADVYLIVARAMHAGGRHAEALDCAEKAAALDPFNEEAFRVLELCYAQRANMPARELEFGKG